MSNHAIIDEQVHSLTGGVPRRICATASAAEQAVGIDTIRVTRPIDPDLRRRLTARGVVNRWIRLKLPFPGATVAVNYQSISFQASLPLVAGMANNVTPVAPEDSGELTHRLIEAGLEEIQPMLAGEVLSPDSFTYCRVDVVRDFGGVDNFVPILDVLQASLQRNDKKFSRHSKGSSLAVSLSNWKASLYDKHAESGGVADLGSVRFEVQLRTKRLKQLWAQERGGHWRRPGDITRESAFRMARDTFVDVGFDAECIPRSSLLDRVTEVSDSVDVQTKLVGLIHEPCLLQDFSRGTVSAYRPLLRQLGSLATGGADPCRLDFDSGRQL